MNGLKRLISSSAFVLGAASLVSPAAVSAQALDSTLDASVRIGLSLETEPDTIFSVDDRGSRIRWSGTSAINTSTNAIGYLELGVDPNAGLNNTRQGWIGVDANFGQVTVGKQYSAYYDVLTVKTDIANWNSCLFQASCTRSDSYLKYSNSFDAGLKVGASAILQRGDQDESFFDVFDGGASFETGGLSFGGAFVYAASEGQADAGFGFGLGAAYKLDSISFAAELDYRTKKLNQRFTEGATEAATTITLAGTFGNAYALVGIQDSNNTPFYLTGGYTFNVSENSYLYAEALINEPDIDGQDINLNFLTTFVYNFEAIRVSAN